MSEEFLNIPVEEVPFVVFDTETSLKSRPGREAFYDIVEIGCVAFSTKGGEIKTFHSLIKPYYPFNRASCRAMHITEAALESAPSFVEVANFISNIFENRVMVGQNTQFDIRTLRQATKLCRNIGGLDLNVCNKLLSKLNWQYLDTKDIFSRLFPSEKQKSLDAIALRIGVDPKRTKHSALEDSQLTLSIFRKLVDLSKTKNVLTLQNLLDFQEGNFGKAKQTSFF